MIKLIVESMTSANLQNKIIQLKKNWQIKMIFGFMNKMILIYF